MGDIPRIVDAVRTTLPKGELHYERRRPAGLHYGDIGAIMRAPPDQVLVARLNDDTSYYALALAQQKALTDLQVAKRFAAIESAATRLLAKLGSPAGDLEKMPWQLRYGRRPYLDGASLQRQADIHSLEDSNALANAVGSVAALAHWSKAAQAALERPPISVLEDTPPAILLSEQSPGDAKRRQRGHGDEALSDYVFLLAATFAAIWGRKASISATADKSSAAVTFVHAVARHLHETSKDLLPRLPSEPAIRERLRRTLK